MADFDAKDIISLHSHTNLRVCISFQVLDFPSGQQSRMFSRVFEFVPGDDVNISVYEDMIKLK